MQPLSFATIPTLEDGSREFIRKQGGKEEDRRQEEALLENRGAREHLVALDVPTVAEVHGLRP